MPGLILITLINALLSAGDALRPGSSQRAAPLGPAGGRLSGDESAALPHLVQELVRTKRHSVQELVQAQPHLVHDMAWPEIHEVSRSQEREESNVSSSSQLYPAPPGGQEAPRTLAAVDDNMDVEEEMERMVHLATPQDPDAYRGHTDAADPETEHLGGPGAGDASQEASGFYGTDMEDRDRGEETGEERDRRGEEDEWGERERRGGDDDGGEGGDADMSHLTPDLDALIGYSPSLHPSSSTTPIISAPAELQESGPQEHRASPVVEMGPLERELWEPAEDVQSSGFGILPSSITTATVTSSASTSPPSGADAAGTLAPETDTGTDFGLLGSFTKDVGKEEESEREEEEEHEGLFVQDPTVPGVGLAPSREPLQPSVQEEEEQVHGERGTQERMKDRGGVRGKEEEEEEEEEEERGTRFRHIVPLTTDPSPTISFTNPSWDWLERTTPLEAQGSEVRGGKMIAATERMKEVQQVVCVDWKDLVGRGYVVLNMTQNLNCEEFRVDQGVRLLKIIERVFAWRMNSPEGSWILFLSKPTHQQHQLLMNVASGHGVIGTTEVLNMLGEIRKSLYKVGIQNYSATKGCQSRPTQTRSDYGKLFVVLVIIGSVCMVIITSGFIYICWQRRLPATKTSFRAEELHFVENGCHDNPTLDVTNDNQPEMQEKKPSTNGLAGGGERGKEESSSRWQVFVNQAATEEEEEEEEQDTHL